MSVVVQSLTKRFGAKSEAAAVSSVSFEAPHGHITSLLGPSGSGKSTLLRLIAGLEEPDAGSVLIDGSDTTRVSPRERGVGFVFQSYALFRHMTVHDNIAFGMQIRKAPKSEINARVAELLKLVQLDGYGKRFPSQLSGGQRQRVALARALATRPKVLLLDEPFGALDAQVRIELREWLLEFHQKTKVTTILVTHDQEEALELSEHVVLLESGKVAQAGSPHDLYDRPANPFVASFLGGANVLRGHVKDGALSFGPHAVEKMDGASEGATVHAFVRPHSIRISRPPPGATGENVGRLERLIRVGGYVKLLVTLPSGESVTSQMSKTEFDTLGIELGCEVVVKVEDAKLFVQNYSI